ncbi:MAG: transposase family protein [Herminiimonas sp.]|nr:transposase family protein [Herminiimonas sp.]
MDCGIASIQLPLTLKGLQIFPCRPARLTRIAQVNDVIARLAALMLRIGLDDAGVRDKAFSPDQTFHDAAAQNGIEQLPEGITVAETTMAVLREARMIRDLILQAQAAEPAVGQVGSDSSNIR